MCRSASRARVGLWAIVSRCWLVPALLTALLLSQLAGASSLAAQGSVVIGTVTDSTGTPLANVQVVASGSRSTLTNERGEFMLRGLPAGSHHLDFVRIGFARTHEEVNIPTTGADVRVSVVMSMAVVRLSGINVTATPGGSDPLDVTQATVQLGGKELQRALSTSVGQTLSKEPGMAARFNGPMASTPVIRGLTGERVLVLQDGERTGDLSSSAADHMNAVDPSTAERIEVIRGPASLLYGNNALGGVVNVISSDIATTIPSRVTGYVMGQSESVTPGFVAGAGVTLPLSPHLALTARGNWRDFTDMRVGGGGRQPNTGGTTGQLTLGGGYVGPRLSLGGVYRQMDFEYGLPHDVDDESVRLDGVRRMGSVQGMLTTGYDRIPSVRVDQTVQSYRHSEIEEDGEIGTVFRLNTQTTNVTAETRFGRTAGAVGIQGLFRQYAPVGEEAFTPAADNENMAVFVYQEFLLSRDPESERAPRLQFGARYDHFTIRTRPGNDTVRFGGPSSRAQNNVAASVGISIPVVAGVSLTGNTSHGFRTPAVEELHAAGFHAAVGTYDVGNPDLKAELSTGIEGGIRAQSSRTFAQLNAYYNMIDGYITPVALPDPVDVNGDEIPAVTFVGRNAVLKGMEAQIETRLVFNIVGGMMGDYTHALIRHSTDLLPYIPAGRLGASLRYDDGRLSVGGDFRRIFAQKRALNDGFDIPTDAYTLLDLSATRLFTVAGWQVHSVTFKVDNVLDERYRDATSRIKRFAWNPGRNIALVYKLLF